MTNHRFLEHLRQPPAALGGGLPDGFVPCPVFALMPQGQQAQVLEIYRIAAERTREQLRPRRRLPAFSVN